MCTVDFGMRKMIEVGIFVFPERICIGGKDMGSAIDTFGACGMAKCCANNTDENNTVFLIFCRLSSISIKGYLVFCPSSHLID